MRSRPRTREVSSSTADTDYWVKRCDRRCRVNNREAGPGLLRPHPRCLSASGATSATAPAQLAHLFFESLHPFCQPVEALVDLLPVPLFVLAPASPGTSLVRASLAPAPACSWSTSPAAATLRGASVAPVSSAAHRCTFRSVFFQLTKGLSTPWGFERNRCH